MYFLFLFPCNHSFALPRTPELDFAHLHVLGSEKLELASEGLSGISFVLMN